ncbi:hypothetical protein ACQKP0_25095 [Heyndrickxia sp. NPDC080065]|uniref:hypothetical protein n=1 Tax=Heyndrickxia sp. NPDC080065 TaxID=3390568 RepID=UPI003CFF5202
MPQQRVYYDYVNKKLVPYLYVMTFKHNEINWDKPVVYFDVIKPFEYIGIDDFDESIISISINKGELLLNKSTPGKLGIHLNSVKKRIMNHNVDPDEVKQFILCFPDVEEVLHLVPNERKLGFCVEYYH